MKKMISLAVVLAAVACGRHNELIYNSPANVYFNFNAQQQDSILYTFAFDPSKESDTLYLPVQLSGTRVNKDRTFLLKAEQDSSTAQPYVHYKPFDSVYTLPANAGGILVPLVIYNTDSLLQYRSVMLKFRLFPTADLGTNLPELIYGKCVFSSKLERPDWWGMWMGDYFSQVKYQLFIITTGQDTLSTNGLDAPKNLYFVSLLTTFLSDPYTWLARNQASGYVMAQPVDGVSYFYNTANPAKKILYQYDAQANQYFFIDENGQEVH
ncbi:MAG TPA: DUF4843 domain-containing protein [Dinghuibacter sp.]|uniref:DUF4843 domain-containing protein n=1 Tax=Dinghuibacter sp. TaxID=2024697 RepID=UPI002CA5AE26|nr:DUF4843 domain-containing protein [Dinghuibacter sp.]HTJ11186.1 DUF4843 domain-containing protein [Dinghuibacter sp.]